MLMLYHTLANVSLLWNSKKGEFLRKTIASLFNIMKVNELRGCQALKCTIKVVHISCTLLSVF